MGHRLDSYGTYPSGMQEYLSMYGWHFNKKMYNWAVSLLKRYNVAPKPDQSDVATKEQIDDMIKRHNIQINNLIGYDYCYELNKVKAVHLKHSIEDEVHLLKYLKQCLDEPNSYDEKPFTHFYADCIAKGIPIMWEDML